jgi:glycosyltransferase involved in cell wall biosynthesis
MLLVDSLYINNGGGKVLLDYLVEKLERSGLDVFYLFDERCKRDFQTINDDRRLFLKATIINRYLFYITNKNKFTKILCFGNIPIPIRIKHVDTYTYFHNISLLIQPSNYGLKERLKKKLKIALIGFFNTKQNIFIVQSNSVKALLNSRFTNNKIEVLPFYKKDEEILNTHLKEKDTFVYVSNGNTHKNHFKLFKAWELLAEEGYFPTIHLTITDNYINHIHEIGRLQNLGVKIINHGYCDPKELYKYSQFLIYPSLVESFGLGLIEAIDYKCEVIASNLDYVFEVCKPMATFDPLNEVDIKDTVKKVLLLKEENIYNTVPIIKNKIDELIELLN